MHTCHCTCALAALVFDHGCFIPCTLKLQGYQATCNIFQHQAPPKSIAFGNQFRVTQGADASADTSSQQQHTRQYDRVPFDGRRLLANYSDIDLEEKYVSEQHLSQKGKYREDWY